jgi:hypothetical protein
MVDLDKRLERVKDVSNNGNYSSTFHTIEWQIGSVEIGVVGSVSFSAQIASPLDTGTLISNRVYIESKKRVRKEIASAQLEIESGVNLIYSTKDVEPKTGVGLGSYLLYTITVRNDGDMAGVVMVQDMVSDKLSFCCIKSRADVVSGKRELDLTDSDGWGQFDDGKVDGRIEVVTDKGRYRSKYINSFNYPTINSLIEEIEKSPIGVQVEYYADRFTLTADGWFVELSEEGDYPFFSAAKIPIGLYCTGEWNSGSVVWKIDVGAGETKSISFGAQVIEKGEIENRATLTSGAHSVVVETIKVWAEAEPPVLAGIPVEDSDSDGADDDADTDGEYKVLLPEDKDDYEIIWYEVQERVGTGSWKSIDSAIPPSTRWYQVSGRSKGNTYYYRVRAKNGAGWGNFTDTSDGIRVVDEWKVVSPEEEYEMKYNSLSVQIPESAFLATVTFTIEEKRVIEAAAVPAISEILKDSVYELLAISADGVGTQPVKPLTLLLPYRDPDLENEDDDLSYRVYRLENGVWRLVEGAQRVYPDKDIVRAEISHLSIYGVGSPVGVGIWSAKVYPSPLKLDECNRLKFEIPGWARIRVFNIAGECVFETEEYGSLWEWDLLNSEGERVASGVYFAVIEDADGNNVIRRFAIIK